MGTPKSGGESRGSGRMGGHRRRFGRDCVGLSSMRTEFWFLAGLVDAAGSEKGMCVTQEGQNPEVES